MRVRVELFDNFEELPIKSTLTLIVGWRGIALKHCFALLVIGCGGVREDLLHLVHLFCRRNTL